MSWDREKTAAAFKEEAYELLGELEATLLELEKAPQDRELVGRIFRALHTLKGTGSMFGYEDIATLVHDAETVFDLVRGGKLGASKDLISLSLAMGDTIHSMIGKETGSSDEEARDRLAEAFGEILSAAGYRGEPDAPDSSKSVGSESDTATYLIRFRPPKFLFLTGTNPLGMIDELRSLGRCSVIAYTDDIPDLDVIAPELCYTRWDIILSTCRGRKDIEDTFMFVEKDSDISIDALWIGDELNSDEGHMMLEAVLVQRGSISEEETADVLTALGPDSLASGGNDSGESEDAVCKAAGSESSSIRVSSDKLDKLVNLAGEMVTMQARLSQVSDSRQDPDLTSIAEEVGRLTEELRDNTMGLRMVPIGTIFRRFGRLVRDLSMELGKEVELSTEGAETELDKNVIDKLGEPLVHIIRNCVDHGIEPPQERISAGKNRAGHIHVSAFHSGAFVCIRIRDDGRGLDSEVIKAKAAEKGLIAVDSDISAMEASHLVFQPGFSTAREINSISGRGVGLDAVRKCLDGIRGSVELESEAGSGTTITLKMPLTLAIIESLLVKISEEYFIIPLYTIEECVELTMRDIEKSNGSSLLSVRGEIVPYISLRSLFVLDGEAPPIEQVVITRAELGRIGFVVDSVIAEHQAVIKSLGSFYGDIAGISGATILGDGRVALMLDVPKLIRSVQGEEERRI